MNKEEEYRDNVKNYGFSLFVLCNKYIRFVYAPLDIRSLYFIAYKDYVDVYNHFVYNVDNLFRNTK